MIKCLAHVICALFLVAFLCISYESRARVVQVDSISLPARPSNWSLTNLFNSGSMFYFTGVVSDHRPSFDMKLVYTGRSWGALVFKSFEMSEHNPAINYALVVLNKKYTIGKRIMISPQAGVQLNQIGSIAGPGSDFLTNLSIVYKIGRYYAVSNDAVMQNLILTNRANWTNRLKASYQKAAFNASASIWHRNRFFGNPGYLSAGVNVVYSGIKLSPAMNLVMGASSVNVFQADTYRRSGFMLSLGVGM